MTTSLATGPRRRLHPLTPLLKGARALVVIIAALSWQTLGRVGLGWFAAMVVAALIGQVILSVISWYVTGYQVVGRELRIHEGLVFRRTRAIPLERLQSVEVVRPLLAQLTGLAELRLEVVGGGKTEAPLAFLTVDEARALRERLLVLAGKAGAAVPAQAAAEGEAVAPVAHPERPIHAVANRDLLISQLLTPQTLFLPFGVAFVAVQFAAEATWSFIGIASTLTAMAGVLLQPVRRILADWNFRLASQEGSLRLRGGLLETRSQTVPLDRLQAVGATWPLLWRRRRWLRLRPHVAGIAAPSSGDDSGGGRLLPVGDPETARLVLAEALPGVALDTIPFTPPSRRARWLHPLSWRILGAALTDQVVAHREGLLTRQVLVVPYARIQSVRVVRGPLQRRLGLATVYADTAGGPSAAARDRDVSEAWELAATLAERSRAARSVPAPH
ncbi:PH domain-containing protein [Phytohabitans sp. ZYX-F-186]|uniref:PH domain-containing protein n=1 Tax=Phytohabitans maris TaxID=3071409 RepID=A0ABU0ZB49_9ACTN|nr:PH domain-containing protein [Phytohabitans sp. ZYX-F-186]MDQ7904286.1 PH domain-containing protein [Phytohabitans sp. ZYX-F-186]